MAWAMVSLNLDESPEIGKRSLQNKDGAALATPNTKAAKNILILALQTIERFEIANRL